MSIIRGCYAVIVSVAVISAGGCAYSKVTGVGKSASPVFVSDTVLPVPFVRQEKLHCGPAALESVFAFWQGAATQQEIGRQIFCRAIRGTLMIDLARLAQEEGFVALLVQADLHDIMRYLTQGIPVITLERVHPYVLGRNHFTVITGMRDHGRVIMQHTGRSAHRGRPRDGFLRNWQAAGNWMLVVAPPEELAESSDPAVLLEAGVAYERRGNLTEALALYIRVMDLVPQAPQAYFNAGNIYAAQNDLKQAEHSYRQALRYQPEFADAYNNLAHVYLRQKQFSPAQDAVTRALALNPSRGFYYWDTQARIHWELGKRQSAQEAVAAAQALAETVPYEHTLQFINFWRERLPEQ